MSVIRTIPSGGKATLFYGGVSCGSVQRGVLRVFSPSSLEGKLDKEKEMPQSRNAKKRI